MSVAQAHGHRWRAWKSGVLLQARIYPAVASILVLAAICEAITVIVFMA
jgi:hypothetical protein